MCSTVHCPDCGSILSHQKRRSVLTPQERRIMALLADEALSNPEIAARLDIAEQTVKRYLANAFLKLGVTNRVELAVLWHTEIFQLGLAS